jgi:hypothetical protein
VTPFRRGRRREHSTGRVASGYGFCPTRRALAYRLFPPLRTSSGIWVTATFVCLAARDDVAIMSCADCLDGGLFLSNRKRALPFTHNAALVEINIVLDDVWTASLLARLAARVHRPFVQHHRSHTVHPTALKSR